MVINHYKAFGHFIDSLLATHQSPKSKWFARYRSAKITNLLHKRTLLLLRSRLKIINFNGFFIGKSFAVFLCSRPTTQRPMLNVKPLRNLCRGEFTQVSWWLYYNVNFSFDTLCINQNLFSQHQPSHGNKKKSQITNQIDFFVHFDWVSRCCEGKYYVFDDLNSNKYGNIAKHLRSRLLYDPSFYIIERVDIISKTLETSGFLQWTSPIEPSSSTLSSYMLCKFWLHPAIQILLFRLRHESDAGAEFECQIDGKFSSPSNIRRLSLDIESWMTMRMGNDENWMAQVRLTSTLYF